MRYVKSFALGSSAIGILVVAGALALSAFGAAGAAPDRVDIGLGPFDVIRVNRDGATTETALGAGALLVALAGGVANCVALTAMRRRGGASDPMA
jgi:hypothetical protein